MQHCIENNFLIRKKLQQDDITERIIKPLNERARCLLLNVGISKGFWVEMINIVCYLINRSNGLLWRGTLFKVHAYIQ